MQYPSQHKPTTLNLDKALGDLTPNESYYILNHTSLLNVNNFKVGNTGPGKPLPANYLACDIQQPSGEVYTGGAYRSPLTKEIYTWHINSNGVNYILRVKETGCEIVYFDGCLELSAEPRHSIENWRAFLHIEKICSNRDGKYLKWTNGVGDLHLLDVEASIATNSFTTAFFNRCPDPCSYINMCVPDPCGCLQAEWVPFDSADIGLNNFMLDQPFQFIYRHWYYDGRKSEWSTPSSTYYQSTKSCNALAFSRGIKLRVPVGNPFVDKIEIGFTVGGDVWFSTEIVEKYKKYNNAQQKWYDRSLEVLSNYSDVDCSFDYIFYNDRQKINIDPKEISRVFNPIPRNAQGLIQIKDADGVYNYESGTCPIDKTETEKFDVNINCSQQPTGCVTKYASVKFRAVIVNHENNKAGFVFRDGIVNEPDDVTVPAFFGSKSYQLSDSYGLKFADGVRNFIGYVEGTDYWTQMEQWEAGNNFVNPVKKDVVAIPKDFSSPIVGSYIELLRDRLYNSGKFMFQQGELKVPKGTKGFIRLVSHFQSNGLSVNQNTSTNVRGIFNITNFVNGSSIFSLTNTRVFELYFDTCNGDVTLENAFYVGDTSAEGSGGSAYAGYIKDVDDKPIIGAEIRFQSSSDTISTSDHNGFYYFYKSGADNADIHIQLENNCNPGFSIIRTTTIDGIEAGTMQTDFTITENDFANNFYAQVVVPVRDCDDNPIPGAIVALSGNKYQITDNAGNATFRVRNFVTRDRTVTSVLMNKNGCFLTDCNDQCSPCMPAASMLLPACFSNVPSIQLGDHVINLESVINDLQGLKAGGRYEFAFNVKGKCGRLSAAYPIKYIDIPKTQVKGYLGFCSFVYDATGMVLPDWAHCVQILRSGNLNNYELQWKVDKIEKTDNGNLKLTIQSLNDYNKQYALKTNTTYQFLEGDHIEFIINGDGNILVFEILNYRILSPFHDQVISGEENAESNFFNQILIQDDGRLVNLKEGAIFELQRPVPPQTEQIYHSICATIPVVNGQLLYPYGTFNTFDTFFVNRVISSTNGSFQGTFEHHSPSDFWGTRVSDAGKRYVANQFENERRFGRNMSINSPTNFSYFGDLVKKFEAPGQGDITAMTIVDGKIIMAICENDNFLAQASDEFVRVGGDGIIRALPPDAIVSEAEPKLYGAYGCQYDDIGAVLFGDGWTTYVDSNKKVYVHHDYSVAKNASLGKTESYFRLRCQEKERHNSLQSDAYNKYRWATGLNFTTGEVYLTLKTLRMASINNDFNPYTKKNTTLIYHPDLGEFLGFASYTPEMYSQLDLSDDGGCSFVAYSQGSPFIHPVITNRFNEFFGITVDEVVGVVINKFPEKEKLAQAIEVQGEMLWFAAEITTDKANFISEIPAIRWKRSNGKWNANFLFDKNSRGGLYGNSKDGIPKDTRGRFIAITLVKDNTIGLRYGTIDNAKRIMYNELDLIFTKCSIIEQSGFSENL